MKFRLAVRCFVMTNCIDILYVHVPFCVRRCDYCSFHSTDGVPIDGVHAYLDRLAKELAVQAKGCSPLRRVFIGGGTPNALAPSELDRLLGLIHDNFELADDYEFTVECNPSSLTAEKIALLTEAKVNRLSLGIQSFLPHLRKTIGRIGDLPDVHHGLTLALDAFENVNCDLIFGIPEQTIEDWRADLNAVADLGVTHISTYALSVDQGTPLALRAAQPLDEERFVGFWDATDTILNSVWL